jgi:hypothetical protein
MTGDLTTSARSRRTRRYKPVLVGGLPANRPGGPPKLYAEAEGLRLPHDD